MKLTLRLISLAGLLLFGTLFAATFASPIEVERAARGFIEHKIKQRIEATLDISDDKARETRLGQLAEKLAEKNKEKLEALRERLASGLNERIAAVVARMQELNCECRALLRGALDAVTAGEISELESAGPQLRQMIEGNYIELVRALMLDVRVFAGTNAVAFLMLLILSMTRQDRIQPLFIPGLLLAVSTVVAASFYLFGRDWFFTILHANYMGWGYTAWVLVIFGFMTDIALFKARGTTTLLSALGSTVASAATPC